MTLRRWCGSVAEVTRKERITYLTGLDMLVNYDDNSDVQSLAVKVQLCQLTTCFSARLFLEWTLVLPDMTMTARASP